MGRGATCALVVVTLLAGGCGSDDGRDRAESGSTEAQRPSRGFEGATAKEPLCTSSDRLVLDALNDITCARARQVFEAYAEMYEDCSFRQLTSGDCTVPDGAEANDDQRRRKSPLGTWRVKLARGSETAAWTGAAASNANESFSARPIRTSALNPVGPARACSSEKVFIRQLEGRLTCAEAVEAYGSWRRRIADGACRDSQYCAWVERVNSYTRRHWRAGPDQEDVPFESAIQFEERQSRLHRATFEARRR